ncbi:hypothetical protein [Indioceanicola profundi]|uniref:hypothetical protein n=1 Tax=Indioceanicola profundi TaxID=2220096 RepID=UPI0013C45B23|nr:hypothetical protein [Indioceanicola profundi]
MLPLLRTTGLAALAVLLTTPGASALAQSALDDRGWYAPAGRGLEPRGPSWSGTAAGSMPTDPYERLYGREREPEVALGTPPAGLITGLDSPLLGGDPYAVQGIPGAPFPDLRSITTPNLGAADPDVPGYCQPAATPGASQLCLTPEGDWVERE